LQSAVRIIIPAHNAERTIQQCIELLLEAMMFHLQWEIVVVDNGRNPGLLSLIKDNRVTVLKRDQYSSAAYARNEGAKGFFEGILVFVDSDVMCERNCIEKLIAPILENISDATIGNYSKNVSGLSFSQKYKQLYIHHIYDRKDAIIKNDFWTAICAVDANVFHQLGGFNADFKGANGEDQEFGIRMTRSGYSVLPVRDANGQHLNPYGVLDIIRNDFRKGLTAVRNSLENNVAFSDNRHSRWRDMLSVFFSVMTVVVLFLGFIMPGIWLFTVLPFSGWLACRNSLNAVFLKNGGMTFLVRALLLMFCLDLVRFTCVVIGVVKFRFMHRSELKMPTVSIPVKT
jgi:glycosyltransferase involved in cell wall biosynthesis